MNKKVNELVNEYISMYEVEKFKGGEKEMKNIAWFWIWSYLLIVII